jgi:hypothetical protein
MAFQVSPGVQVKELDLTAIVPTIATTPAGFVGLFSWGPANEISHYMVNLMMKTLSTGGLLPVSFDTEVIFK